MLAQYLTTSVPHVIRAKGARYHSMGAVVAISGGEWTAHAVVRGGRNYRVEIARDGDGFRASCDCAYFVDRAEVCKHIWAAVSEADERNLLDGDGVLSDEAFLEADVGRANTRKRPDVPLPLQKAPPRPGSVSSPISPSDSTPATGCRPTAASPMASSSTRSTCRRPTPGADWSLQVLHRRTAEERRVGQAEAGGRCRSRTSTACPSRTTATLIVQLIGAVDQAGSRRLLRADAGRARDLSAGSVRSPRGCCRGWSRPGACTCRSSADSRKPRRSSGTTAPAWEFDLEMTSDPGGALTSAGSSARRRGRWPSRDPVLLLEAGFLDHPPRGGAVRAGRCLCLADRAAPRQPASRSRPAAADSLAEALARAGVKPDMLPERLRYEVEAPPPQPSVTLARTNGRPSDAFRDTLGALSVSTTAAPSSSRAAERGIYDAARSAG